MMPPPAATIRRLVSVARERRTRRRRSRPLDCLSPLAPARRMRSANNTSTVKATTTNSISRRSSSRGRFLGMSVLRERRRGPAVIVAARRGATTTAAAAPLGGPAFPRTIGRRAIDGRCRGSGSIRIALPLLRRLLFPSSLFPAVAGRGREGPAGLRHRRREGGIAVALPAARRGTRTALLFDVAVQQWALFLPSPSPPLLLRRRRRVVRRRRAGGGLAAAAPFPFSGAPRAVAGASGVTRARRSPLCGRRRCPAANVHHGHLKDTGATPGPPQHLPRVRQRIEDDGDWDGAPGAVGEALAAAILFAQGSRDLGRTVVRKGEARSRVHPCRFFLATRRRRPSRQRQPPPTSLPLPP
jgi:hypothetical protein